MNETYFKYSNIYNKNNTKYDYNSSNVYKYKMYNEKKKNNKDINVH